MDILIVAYCVWKLTNQIYDILIKLYTCVCVCCGHIWFPTVPAWTLSLNYSYLNVQWTTLGVCLRCTRAIHPGVKWHSIINYTLTLIVIFFTHHTLDNQALKNSIYATSLHILCNCAHLEKKINSQKYVHTQEYRRRINTKSSCKQVQE